MTGWCVRLRESARRGCRDDRGFTLLEVVVSFTLFAMVAGGATYGMVTALTASHVSQQRVDAANVAQSFIAAAETKAATIAPESNAGYAAGVAGEQFTVKRTIAFTNAGQSQCSPGTTFRVSVSVFQKNTGTFLARSDSLVAC